MQGERLPKLTFKYNPMGKIKRGSPKKRWKDQAWKEG